MIGSTKPLHDFKLKFFNASLDEAFNFIFLALIIAIFEKHYHIHSNHVFVNRKKRYMCSSPSAFHICN